MQVATTLRLPQELDERLSAYCEDVGAVKNKVVVLALRVYLGAFPKCDQEFVDALRSESDAREVERARRSTAQRRPRAGLLVAAVRARQHGRHSVWLLGVTASARARPRRGRGDRGEPAQTRARLLARVRADGGTGRLPHLAATARLRRPL